VTSSSSSSTVAAKVAGRSQSQERARLGDERDCGQPGRLDLRQSDGN
jgi:hypothetical protein